MRKLLSYLLIGIFVALWANQIIFGVEGVKYVTKLVADLLNVTEDRASLFIVIVGFGSLFLGIWIMPEVYRRRHARKLARRS